MWALSFPCAKAAQISDKALQDALSSAWLEISSLLPRHSLRRGARMGAGLGTRLPPRFTHLVTQVNEDHPRKH